MGNIREILARVNLPSPELGWDEKEESFCLPFSVELKENIHIHWQDIRIEMTAADFSEFAQAISRAHNSWIQDGKPETSHHVKFYGAWPGEEEFDFSKDRHLRKDRFGHLRHHYRLFPRTQMGELYYDSILQIEIQHYNWFHIHYKNFRYEIGPKSFLSVADAFTTSARKYRQMAMLWSALYILENNVDKSRRLVSHSFIGKIKRCIFKKLANTFIGKIKRWIFN